MIEWSLDYFCLVFLSYTNFSIIFAKYVLRLYFILYLNIPSRYASADSFALSTYCKQFLYCLWVEFTFLNCFLFSRQFLYYFQVKPNLGTIYLYWLSTVFINLRWWCLNWSLNLESRIKLIGHQHKWMKSLLGVLLHRKRRKGLGIKLGKDI